MYEQQMYAMTYVDKHGLRFSTDKAKKEVADYVREWLKQTEQSDKVFDIRLCAAGPKESEPQIHVAVGVKVGKLLPDKDALIKHVAGKYPFIEVSVF